MQHNERQTMARIGWRIMPLLLPAVCFAYLDRINLSFAALSMDRDLGLTHRQFGVAAGVFSIGIALAAIPSTLMLHRFGARRWISLTMFAWGLCSAATAFVSHSTQLFALRALLGMAEAGLAPGTVLYASYWFPVQYRSRIFGSVYVAQLGTQLIGSPISGGLLAMNGRLGLSGWQWLFLIEALPTLALAVIVWMLLPDKPEDARWLGADEKHWVEERLAAEQPPAPALPGLRAIWRVLGDRRVWLLTAVCLGLGTAGIGAIFFLPQIIQSMGFSDVHTGWVAAMPAAVSIAALPLWSMYTSSTRTREWVVVAGCGVVTFGLLTTAALLPSPWAIVPISIVLAGFFGCLTAFWTLPSAFMSGAAAAAGIAFINLCGNFGQFTGPYLLGWFADRSHSYTGGLVCLAVVAAAAAALMSTQAQAVHRRIKRLARSA